LAEWRGVLKVVELVDWWVGLTVDGKENKTAASSVEK
jgi:hypothetical protein